MTLNDIQSGREVPWDDFKVIIAEYSLESFSKTLPNPFLIFVYRDAEDSSKDEDDPPSTIYDDQQNLKFSVNRTIFYLPFANNGRNETIRIGRATLNDLYIDHTGVSKRHAIIVLTPQTDEILLMDALSKNGTAINGRNLEEKERYPLKPGDKIGLSRGIIATFQPPGAVFRLLQAF